MKYTATIENEVVNFREDDGKEKLFMTYQQTIMEERMFAREKGREEGREEGIEQVAKEMLKNNMPLDLIAKLTKLTIAQIENLAKKSASII